MPPPKEKGALRHAPLLSKLSPTEYRWSLHLQAHWGAEANRLFTEYQRTGKPAHLKAYRVHCAAMTGRLQRKGAIR